MKTSKKSNNPVKPFACGSLGRSALRTCSVLVQRELEFSGSRLSHGFVCYQRLLCFRPTTLGAPLTGLGQFLFTRFQDLRGSAGQFVSGRDLTDRAVQTAIVVV